MKQILVIEVIDSWVSQVISCETSEEAESKFLQILRENVCDFGEYTQEDIASILDDGYEMWDHVNSVCIYHL